MKMLIFVVILASGCEANTAAKGGDYTCPNNPGIGNPAKKLHGAACATKGECAYSVCNVNALQLAGHVTATEGVCTKDCSCGPNSGCDIDNGNGVEYKCIKAKSGPGSECAIACTSDAQCKAINPRFDHCGYAETRFTSGVKVCTLTP